MNEGQFLVRILIALAVAILVGLGFGYNLENNGRIK